MHVWPKVQSCWYKIKGHNTPQVLQSHMISLNSKATVHTFFSTLDFFFHSSLNVIAAVISQILMLFGIRKRTLSVMIIKSCTSGRSGVATESWLAYCISSWKLKLLQALLTTHLQMYWPTSTGQHLWGQRLWMLTDRASCVRVCVSVCACLFVCMQACLTMTASE